VETLSREIVTTQISRVARRGAKILKIAAVAIVVGAVVNGWFAATVDQSEFYGGPSTDFPFKWKLQQFLNAALGNLAWAALILAAAIAIELVGLRAARLPEAPVGLPDSMPASPTPTATPTNFAARPAPAPTPPPMMIAGDEDIWRR